MDGLGGSAAVRRLGQCLVLRMGWRSQGSLADSSQCYCHIIPPLPGLGTPNMVALGSLPAAELLSHIPSFSVSQPIAPIVPSTPLPSEVAPTTLVWSVSSSAPVGAEPSLAGQLAALLQRVSQPEASARDRVTIGPGLPTIPCKLLDKMHRWEYIDLAEPSAHDATTPEVDPHRFVLFPGCEFIKPKKHSIESISQWVKAFAIYTAAMGNRFVEAIPEMLAYMLVIVNASEQYDGLYWRTYDTHFRVNAAATGNRQWSRLDIDLYTRFLLGGPRQWLHVLSVIARPMGQTGAHSGLSPRL